MVLTHLGQFEEEDKKFSELPNMARTLTRNFFKNKNSERGAANKAMFITFLAANIVFINFFISFIFKRGV